MQHLHNMHLRKLEATIIRPFLPLLSVHEAQEDMKTTNESTNIKELA